MKLEVSPRVDEINFLSRIDQSLNVVSGLWLGPIVSGDSFPIVNKAQGSTCFSAASCQEGEHKQ